MGNWKILDVSAVEKDFEDDYNIKVRGSYGTGMPPITNVITPYGLVDGGKFQRSVVGVRQFALEMTTVVSTQTAMLTARKDLINLIRRDRQATEGAVTIRFSYGGTKLDIDCFYQGGLEGGKPEKYNEQFTVQFVAPDPFWKESTTVTQALTVNGTVTEDNQGTAEAFPTFTIAGEGAVTQISNDDTGKVINLNLAILTGETVTIDLSPGVKTISSDVRGNLLYTVSNGSNLSTWSMLPGDNDVSVTATGTLDLAVNIAGDALGVNALEDTLGVGVTTLNITTFDMAYNNRHWSVDGVV